jgi:hypothetical protein
MMAKIHQRAYLVCMFALLAVVIACGSMPPLAAPTATNPDSDIADPPTQTPTLVVETEAPQAPSELTKAPSNLYIDEKYHFSFEIPEGWVLEELTWIENPDEEPRHALRILKGFHEIILDYKTVFEDFHIGPRGMPYGEIIKLNEIPILGRHTPGFSLVADGKTKHVFYGIRSEEFRASCGLRMMTGPNLDYTYEDIDLPVEIQADFISLLMSFTRTGPIELPEAIALIAEFPVILPMEKSYYSQIYDTDIANACGPAAALMVLDFYGLEDSLDAVIKELRALPSPGAFDPGCYVNTVCTSPDALSMLLYNYDLRVFPHEDWTLEEIFAVVAKGYPIIADILWDPETQSLGHFVVIYGVDIQSEIIYYHDPYRGKEMITSWDEFALAWEGRVDIGDPLKPEGHRFWGLEVRDR